MTFRPIQQFSVGTLQHFDIVTFCQIQHNFNLDISSNTTLCKIATIHPIRHFVIVTMFSKRLFIDRQIHVHAIRYFLHFVKSKLCQYDILSNIGTFHPITYFVRCDIPSYMTLCPCDIPFYHMTSRLGVK